jgi:hypothetical protein
MQGWLNVLSSALVNREQLLGVIASYVSAGYGYADIFRALRHSLQENMDITSIQATAASFHILLKSVLTKQPTAGSLILWTVYKVFEQTIAQKHIISASK